MRTAKLLFAVSSLVTPLLVAGPPANKGKPPWVIVRPPKIRPRPHPRPVRVPEPGVIPEIAVYLSGIGVGYLLLRRYRDRTGAETS
jgi:hypothetical protein